MEEPIRLVYIDAELVVDTATGTRLREAFIVKDEHAVGAFRMHIHAARSDAASFGRAEFRPAGGIFDEVARIQPKAEAWAVPVLPGGFLAPVLAEFASDRARLLRSGLSVVLGYVLSVEDAYRALEAAEVPNPKELAKGLPGFVRPK